MATVNQFSQPCPDLLRPNKCDPNKFTQLILLIQQKIVIHTQLLLYDGIRCNRYTLTTDFCKSPFVDQLPYTLQVRVAPCHVRFTDTQHVYCGLELNFYK